MNLKILDNFLEKKDLDDISSIKLEKINKNGIRVYHNSIDKNNNTLWAARQPCLGGCCWCLSVLNSTA